MEERSDSGVLLKNPVMKLVLPFGTVFKAEICTFQLQQNNACETLARMRHVNIVRLPFDVINTELEPYKASRDKSILNLTLIDSFLKIQKYLNIYTPRHSLFDLVSLDTFIVFCWLINQKVSVIKGKPGTLPLGLAIVAG